MVEILLIPAQAVPAAWPEALPHLEKPVALSRGCFELEDVAEACARGDMQLWLAIDGETTLAAYVTEIVQYPRKRRVRATFAGGTPGTMGRWLEPMVEAIEAWSKQWGCSGIEALGRKGWSRVVDGEEVGTYLCRDYPALELH